MDDNEVDALKARLAEVEEKLHYVNGVADLAMKHRDAAEARIAVLEKALAEVLDMYFPMSGPTAVKQPPLILEARTALAAVVMDEKR